METLGIDGADENSGGAGAAVPSTEVKKKNIEKVSETSGLPGNGEASLPMVSGVEAADCSGVADSSEAAEHREAAAQEYHYTKFWKNLTVGVVTPANSKTVWTATVDLCRHLLAQENPVLFMVKAAKLAAQLRDLKDSSLSKLLVDHAALQKLFTLDPNVELNVQTSLWNYKVSMTSGTSQQPDLFYWSESLKADSAKVESGFTSCVSGMFNGSTTDPLIICLEDTPEAPLRLGFCDQFLYKRRDQPWLEAFLSSVYTMSETQALIFGPALACLFVKLTRTGSWSLPEYMCKLRSMLIAYAGRDSEVGKMMGELKVTFPPKQRLGELVRFVEPALKQLPQVYFNTVVGGFMLVDQNSDNGEFVKMMMGELRFYQVEMVKSLRFLNSDKFHVSNSFHIWAIIERNFSRSMNSYRHYCNRREGNPKLGKRDPFFTYARVFSDRVFGEMTFDGNRDACAFVAVLTDLVMDAKTVRNWPELGPRYKKLIADHECESRWQISHRDALLAENLYRICRQDNVGFRRINPNPVRDEDEHADPVSDVSLKLLSNPFSVLVISRNRDEMYPDVLKRVRFAEGLRHLEIAGANCLKAEFDNVHKALSFFAAPVRLEVLELFCSRWGYVHFAGPLSISDLRCEYEILLLRKVENAADKFTIAFHGVEVPPYVEYFKLRLPVTPALDYKYSYEYDETEHRR